MSGNSHAFWYKLAHYLASEVLAQKPFTPRTHFNKLPMVPTNFTQVLATSPVFLQHPSASSQLTIAQPACLNPPGTELGWGTDEGWIWRQKRKLAQGCAVPPPGDSPCQSQLPCASQNVWNKTCLCLVLHNPKLQNVLILDWFGLKWKKLFSISQFLSKHGPLRVCNIIFFLLIFYTNKIKCFWTKYIPFLFKYFFPSNQPGDIFYKWDTVPI